MVNNKDQQATQTTKWMLYQKQIHYAQANNTWQNPINDSDEDCDCAIVYEKPTLK